DSTVTYTAMSSPFGELPDIGSPGVDGPPVMPEDPYAYVVAAFQAPSSPDYMPGLEYPPSPEFIPEPVYPEFMPLEDEILPAEEQPLPAAVSPTADSPDYVPESDPEEDPEEDDDEDPEEDPADYPIDEGDDDDDEDESFDDDEDKEFDIEGDEEEEEHPAPAYSTFITIFPMAITTTLDSLTTTTSITLGLRYEVGESSSAPTARPPRGFRADYGFFATINREIMWDLERDIGYGITDTWDEMLVDMPGELATDDTEMGRRMTEFTTRVRQDTYEIYTRLDDEQSERQLMAGRLNMLYKDRRVHAHTARLIEAEDRMSREAWGRSTDASDLARAEVMSLSGPAKGPAQPDAPEEAGSSS
ncbi:hypothetical protein Tco_0903787, partial [Tanacetum coccineum]